MQTTLFVLALLLAAQLGERYPLQTESPQGETSQSSGNQVEPAVTEQPTGEQLPADTPPSASSLFDDIDAVAEPLSSGTQSGSTPPQADAPQEPLSQGTPPASSEPPVTSPAAADPPVEIDPAKVLAGIMEPPLEGKLQGTTLTLSQAVDQAVSRVDQTQRVIAYWELSHAVANYHLAFRERNELGDLRQAVTMPGADWDTARENAEDRLALAADRVRVSQEHLSQLMGSAAGFAPLPSDMPFCGTYETRYSQIFQDRSSPLAAQLNELLPRLHKNLSACTEEIADARKWMFRVSDNRGPQSDGSELLRAYELFAARRRLFTHAVKEYNHVIVRYTEVSTPGVLETERLVGMLIRAGGTQATTYDSEVQRAGAQESADPNDSSSNQRQDPGVSGWTPAGVNGERSILVPRG